MRLFEAGAGPPCVTPSQGGPLLKQESTTMTHVVQEDARFSGNVEFQQGIPRDQFQQENLARYPLLAQDWRVHDGNMGLLVAATSDDLGISGATHGTDVMHVNSSDAAGTTIQQKARRQWMLPPEYVAGQTVRFVASVDMESASDGNADLDLSVFKSGGAAVVSGSDLYAGAAVDVNSETAAEYNFELTTTGLNPGDLLDILITLDATDTAGSGVIANIECYMDIDIRG